MWWGCVQAIADVHALDWRSLRLEKLLMPDRGAHPLEQVVNYYDELLLWASSPDSRARSSSAAAEWLRDNIYEPEHLVLCWGDSRLSNILYGPQFEVTAVLDWEIAYIGDHEADLAWLLFVDWACSEYEGVPRLDGTPSREETIERYEQLTGLCGAQSALQRSARRRRDLASPVSRLESRLRNDGLLTDDFDLSGSASNGSGSCWLAAERCRRAAVDVEVRLDDRPHGAAASPAVAAGAARVGDLLRRRGAVGDDVVDHVAGDSGAQADEHLGPHQLLLVDGHEMGELADELRGVGAEARVRHPLRGGVGVIDPLPGADLVVDLLQDHHFPSVVECAIDPDLANAAALEPLEPVVHLVHQRRHVVDR